MAKVRNRHLYGTPEQIKAWKEESDWIGRNMSRITEDGHLEIFAIPPKRRSRPKDENEETKDKTRRPRRGNGYNRYKEMD